MESKDPGIKQPSPRILHPGIKQPSPHIFQSPNYDLFAEQDLRAGHMRPEMGHNHFPDHNLHLHSGPFPHSRPALYPREMHDAIQREMEKRRIREEILMYEMARRRELEVEVRRELMMETELGLRTGIPFGLLPAVMGFDSPMRGLQITGLPLEERIALSLEERMRRESKGVETMPFQRSNNADLRIPEVEPLFEKKKDEEKKKNILLAKPEVNASGSKRKVETPPGIDTNEQPPPDLIILKKKAKEEWTCTLCQISATSEHGLNEHLRGKKHKSKEAASRTNRTGKNYVIRLFPRKTTQSTQIESEPSKNEPEVTEKVQKNGGQEEKKYKHWCEICLVGTYSRKVMNNHKKGKNHLKRLSNGKVKAGTVVNDVVVEEFDDCGEDVISENVEETLDGTGSELHVAEDHPEPDCGIEGECGAGSGIIEAEDCGDVDLTEPQDDDSISDVVLVDNAEDDVARDVSKPESVPENGTEVGDDVARDISKPEDVDEASPENGAEAEDCVARDLSKPDDVDGASPENGIKAEDVARDTSEPEAVDEQSPENGLK